MLGKTPEYVALYSDCYKAEAKSIQTKKATNGCLFYAAAMVVYVVLVMSTIDTDPDPY